MATLAIHSFNRYNLTEEERLNGQILNTLQKCSIQNQIAEISELKIALMFDPNQAMQYAMDESKFTGQLEVLRLLLQDSDQAEIDLRELVFSPQSNQS